MICWNKVLLFKISLMKIKNLKYMLSFVLCSIIFLSAVSFWAGSLGDWNGWGDWGDCSSEGECPCTPPALGCLSNKVRSTGECKCVCEAGKCCWIQLNTVVPFIWDCIEMDTDSTDPNTTNVTSVTAFPILMQWLMKILMSAIMIFSFLMVIVAWLSMTTWAFGGSGFTKWKTIIKNVIISLILLWCSWLILSLINPSFFGG